MADKSIASVDDGIEIGSLGSAEPVNRNEGGKQELPRVAQFSDYASPGDIFDAGTDRATGGFAQPKRRGRPLGSKNRNDTPAKTPQNIAENLERLLLSVHLMGAAALASPELELEESEAKKLASAIREVSKFYPVTLDPKRLALLELGTVAMMVYGTRGVAIYRRVKTEVKPKAPLQVMPNRPAPKTAQATAPVREPEKQNTTESRPLTPNDLFGLDNGVQDLSQL